MSLPGTDGLSLDQAPPLAIPAAFFVTAPIAVVAAGLVLLLADSPLLTQWHPTTIALVHLGTLGFLTVIMFGAMLQMLPVVAGSPVPLPRLSHAVHAALVLGVGLGAAGMVLRASWVTGAGGALLGLAVLLFAGAVGTALWRAPGPDATVWGMRLALAGLVALAGLGLAMGLGHAGGGFPGARSAWIVAHLVVALLGWVGVLLVSVSWRVVPMFYLTEETDPRWAARALALAALGVVGALASLAAGLGPQVIGIAAVPAALVVWVAHPLATLGALRGRRRKRADGSLRFWQAGMGLALACGPLGAASLVFSDPRWALLFGWVAIWGWAGVVMHGMLCRIVPFLVWFHRLSPLVGIVPVPPMRRILPDRVVTRGFVLHLGSVAIGAVAIGTGSGAMAAVTGASLVLVGASLAHALWITLSVRAPSAE